VKVAILYESRSGNTARVANMIGAAAEELGAEVGVWPSGKANLDFLTGADLVFIGTWTDGAIIAGHRPGDSRRLKAIPGIWDQPTAGFVTYAIHAGNVLDKLERVVTDRGGEWIGGRLFKRGRLSAGVGAFVTAAFDAVTADSQT
jgi:flavodoxin